LYARLWIKILHDLGYLKFDEPFKKLINQGKITGDSRFVYRTTVSWYVDNLGDKKITDLSPEYISPFFISSNIIKELERTNFSDSILQRKLKDELSKLTLEYISSGKATQGEFRFMSPHGDLVPEIIAPLHAHIDLVNGLELKIEDFKKWQPQFENAEFILEDGKYICGSANEKMSKSYFNVVNPDEIINNYGADTLRMYEMFLGPLEQSKPWNTNGIDGVFKFLRRFWNLFHDSSGNFTLSDAEPTRDELKVFHKTIKKIAFDIDNYSFNTSVSEFMICANELSSLKCNKKSILEPLVIALAPFAPHVAEELWEKLGHADTIFNASFPQYDEQYLTESSFNYPISINGKVRAQMNFALDMPKEDIEKVVLASEIVLKWTEGKPPKKVIVVQGKIVNVVL
jgi:leucyl-tRNA synthetase